MRREGSEYGKLIHEINQAGKIVPSHITVGLLENEINKLSTSDQSVCLIDGFPRYIPLTTSLRAYDFFLEIKKILIRGQNKSTKKNSNWNFVYF